MKNNKILSLGLAFLLTFASPLHVLAAPETAASETMGTDSGALAEVIEIHTADEFVNFARQCSLDAWSSGKRIELKEDIDLSETDFPMIPVFSGTFEGGGHTISGFHSVGDGYVGGLFRYIRADGVVTNLKLKGSVEGTEEKECIGSICGVNYGTIRNCSFQGVLNGKDTVGGIAGANEASGFISGCSIQGRVSGYYMTGGITGINHGVVTYCTNYSGINDDTAWVEEDDEMGTALLFSINVSEDEIDFYSGVDTGGIAGYSDGTISRCTNMGTVGYEHTGYNIGGIAGRQAGMISLCVNNGQVYGRKDVGGIAGQMEPYIEVDEAQSLRNAVNKLHDLIEDTLVDMKDGKDVMKADLDNLTTYGDAALQSGHVLANQLTDFVDSNMGQLQKINDRMEYIADQLPAVMDDLTDAMDAFEAFNKKMKDLGKYLPDINLPDTSSGDPGNGHGQNSVSGNDDLYESLNQMQGTYEKINSSLNNINGMLTDADGSAGHWAALTIDQQEALIQEIQNLKICLAEMTEVSSTVLNDLNNTDLSGTASNIKNDFEDAITQLQKMADSLKDAANGLKSIVNYISSQPSVKLTLLGDDFDTNRENLNSQLRQISDSLKTLSNNASDYSDRVNADLLAVNDQLNIVFNLLADHLSGGDGLSVEEMYEEFTEEDLDSITSGRLDACTNKGIVKGDINIGGIAGSMSIDEEDPEDNAAGNIDYEIGRHFIMKCIIDGCVNEGYITAKKDGAGGIVGYMVHGIVTDSESYGSIDSTEGDYVGGICGESLTVIRRCYALCDVSGGRNVGGIAGYAATLKDCYAIVNVEASKGRMGAIAGEIAEYEDDPKKEEPDVCRNYYVDDELYGIDNISYLDVAEPISYQELLAVDKIPVSFRHLKVIYRINEQYLGTEEVEYGQKLDHLNYPEIPAKEGCYGVWPDCSGEVMSGNLIMDAEYHDDVPVVESSEKTTSDAEGGYEKPYALITQTFTEDTKLSVTTGDEAPPQQAASRDYVLYHVLLENPGDKATDSFAVRLLNPYDDAEIWSLREGVWSRQEGMPRGQYLQTEMNGTEETFCIVKKNSYPLLLPALAAAAAAAAVAVTAQIRRIRNKRKKNAVKK